MDELQRLIGIIERHNSKPVVDLADNKSYESRYYNLVRKNAVASDIEAVKALYGVTVEALPTNYRMLKSRLKSKLYDHLLMIDLGGTNSSSSVLEEHELRQELHKSRILFMLNEHDLLRKIIDKVIRSAKESVYNDIVLEALEIKRKVDLYSLKQIPFQSINQEIQYFKDIVWLEKNAEDIFFNLRFDLNFNVSKKRASLNHLPQKIDQIKDMWLKTGSYKIFEYFFLLQNHYLELIGDYEEILKFNNEVKLMHRNGELNHKRFNVQLNAFVQIYACLRTSRLTEGLTLAEASLELIAPSDVNWFANMENYFLLAMHSQNYALAAELIAKVYESPHYYLQNNLSKERWALMRAFLSIVMQHRLTPEDKEALGNATMISKDKQGFNVFLLVLEFVEFLCKEIDDSEAELLMDRYRKYISNYLRGYMAERARLFLRFMIQILKEQCSYLRVSLESKSMFKKLKVTKPPGEAYAEVEIVPYEHLWELVLDILKKKSELPAS
ncbi:hypothetical protein [Pontibacter vulgaris]|uniref:hypothetical protein n=1 Tax=Pontibacter vulgaris TaxID=2905679 RepID=UPI001FA7C458|nr:hypothetical protein [Pontibacter vulgaris]